MVTDPGVLIRIAKPSLDSPAHQAEAVAATTVVDHEVVVLDTVVEVDTLRAVWAQAVVAVVAASSMSPMFVPRSSRPFVPETFY